VDDIGGPILTQSPSGVPPGTSDLLETLDQRLTVTLPTTASGAVLAFDQAELPSLSLDFEPDTSEMKGDALPEVETSQFTNVQGTGTFDNVSRGAPPTATAMLVALAVAGRDPADITIPTNGTTRSATNGSGSGGGAEGSTGSGSSSGSSGLSSGESGSSGPGSGGSSRTSRTDRSGSGSEDALAVRSGGAKPSGVMVSQGVVSVSASSETASSGGPASGSTSTSDAGVIHPDSEPAIPAGGSNLNPYWEGAKAFGASLWGNTLGGPVNDARQVWANTEGQGMNVVERIYVAGGTGVASAVGVRQLSDAASTHDAVDGHVQSTQERVVKGIGGGVQLVTTAVGANNLGNALVRKVVGKASAEVAEEVAVETAVRTESSQAAAATSEAQAQSAAQKLPGCFAAGTPLLTPNGGRRIEEIRRGDRVMAIPEGNPEAEPVPCEVEEIFENYMPTLDLRVNGRTVRTTAEHPFWVRDRGWVAAQELGVGDQLRTYEGRWVPVEGTDGPKPSAPVYNLSVAQYHTYFVGHPVWGFAVWSHNEGVNPCAAGGNAAEAAELQARFRAGSQGELESAFAKIEPGNIGNGTPTTPASRAFARGLGNATDDAGHAIGRNLGGPGGAASGNIFPQAPSVNRGAVAQFERQIASEVQAGKQVYVRVVPQYAEGATRPTQILYQVRIDGVTTTRVFPNP
jgi:hypothetical protein